MSAIETNAEKSTGEASAHALAFGADSVRQVPLKVIVCGLGRTGTTSIQQALGILGFPTYHAVNVWDSSAHQIAMWNRAMAAKFIPQSEERPLSKLEWDELLGNHMGVVDVPAAWFGPELAAFYPDAKVIITTREKEAWFQSCVSAFAHRKKFRTPWKRLGFEWLFYWNDDMSELIRFMHRKQADVWKFEWYDDDAKPKAMKAYDDYYDEMRACIPESRRMEYRVQEGWGPLCAYLGVDMPMAVVDGERVELPFPRSNDAEAFVAKVGVRRNSLINRALKAWAVRLGVGGMAVYIVYPHVKAAYWFLKAALDAW